MFLPLTNEEVLRMKWEHVDVILVTGDAYIDSPYSGTAVIGKLLMLNGFKTVVISQPNINNIHDISLYGKPKLFWGVTAGSVDSMVANYTASRKRRKKDDFTPGGDNNKRPDRATIKYVNLIKQFDKNGLIVLGGIEASLRRVAHYDYWDDDIRRSILFDSKGDILIYGMGEKSVIELANSIKNNNDYRNIRGLCYISKEKPEGYVELPSYEEVKFDKNKFIEMFKMFYDNFDPIISKGLVQLHGDRYLVHNPSQFTLNQLEFDKLNEMQFEHDAHPEIKKAGKLTGLDTVRFSVNITRGCYGECNYCAITVHQGTTVVSRSEPSVVREINNYLKNRSFKGIIRDIGGPTANMYDMECEKKIKYGKCIDKRCLYPIVCSSIKINHKPLIKLMGSVRNISGIRQAFIASGIRFDLVMKDKNYGYEYTRDVVEYHTSGQLKIAPEHTDKHILKLMGRPFDNSFEEFVKMFRKVEKGLKNRRYLTYYFIAAHPGCLNKNMTSLKRYISDNLDINPEQVQIFTPLPSTYSALMYYTGIDPFNNSKLFVERDIKRKEEQKSIIVKKVR